MPHSYQVQYQGLSGSPSRPCAPTSNTPAPPTQDVAKVDVEQAAVGGEHEVVQVAVAHAQQPRHHAVPARKGGGAARRAWVDRATVRLLIETSPELFHGGREPLIQPC